MGNDSPVWKRINKFWNIYDMSTLEPLESGIEKNFIKLAKEHDVMVVSAAPNKLFNARLKNLESFGVSPDMLRMNQDKIPLILEMKPDVCIEDSPNNIDALAENDITVFYPKYMNYSSNAKERENVIGYDNWSDLLDMIATISR